MSTKDYTYNGVPVTLDEFLKRLNADDQHPERGQITFIQEYHPSLPKGICRGNKENGLYERWYANGQRWKRCNYINGKLQGLYEWWDKDGQIRGKNNYISGELDGLCERWYANGQLMERSSYKDGKLEGLAETWDKNGDLMLRRNFKDGKLEDLYEEWDRSGQLAERCNYKFGKIEGLRETWKYDGKIDRVEFYDAGKVVAEGQNAYDLDRKKAYNCRFSTQHKPSAFSVKAKEILSQQPKTTTPKRVLQIPDKKENIKSHKL